MRLLDDLDDAQRLAVTSEAMPLCIVAGAGSGKTRVLTRRIAYRVATGAASAERSVAVTFTRRAASELRSRLRGLGVDGVHVGTLHSLVYGRLRQYWRDSGRAPRRIFDNAHRRLGSEEQRRRGIIEFDDVLVEFADAVREDRALAEAVRWFFRHVYVDEFQDVSRAQFDAVMAIAGDRGDLCVVGDPDQSIYGWNGADPSLMASVPGLEVVRLDANYRSSPAIVSAAASVLERPAPVALGRDGEAPTISAFGAPGEEAAAVARGVRLAHGPHSAWKDIAVLARSNGYLEAMADALSAAGIPFHISGRLSLLGRPSVRESLNALPSDLAAVTAASQLRSRAHDYDDPVERGAVLEVAELAVDFDAVCRGGTVAAFREWLPTTRPGDALNTGDAVQLVTFHKAKGLEWPTVFVVGAHDGLVPISGGDVDEERRLLYVAMTRAERDLHISHVGPKSPFLPDDLDALATPPDGPAHVAALRQALAAARPTPPRRRRHPAA
jgi:DNA helicase II / ATP-dependent DNA helicase PcrA